MHVSRKAALITGVCGSTVVNKQFMVTPCLSVVFEQIILSDWIVGIAYVNGIFIGKVTHML